MLLRTVINAVLYPILCVTHCAFRDEQQQQKKRYNNIMVYIAFYYGFYRSVYTSIIKFHDCLPRCRFFVTIFLKSDSFHFQKEHAEYILKWYKTYIYIIFHLFFLILSTCVPTLCTSGEQDEERTKKKK